MAKLEQNTPVGVGRTLVTEEGRALGRAASISTEQNPDASGNGDDLQTVINDLLMRVGQLERGEEPTRTTAGTYWLGISEDATITAAELTVSSDSQYALVVPSIAQGQRRYIAYARPASEGAFTYVYYYVQGDRDTTNRINAWQPVSGVVTKDGVDLTVIITRAAYRGPIGDLTTPNTVRVVEAG